MSTMVSNLMADTEVSNLVKLANEAFQCLEVCNLDLCVVYNQVSDHLCLKRKLLAVAGTLQKL